MTLFCKNVFDVDVFQTRSMVDEYNCVGVSVAYYCAKHCKWPLSKAWRMTNDPLPLLWYLGFRACQDFFVQHGRYPGTIFDDDKDNDDDVTDSLWNDAALLQQQCLVDVVAAYRLSDNELIQSTLLRVE